VTCGRSGDRCGLVSTASDTRAASAPSRSVAAGLELEGVARVPIVVEAPYQSPSRSSEQGPQARR
jgi:hypothetical protein